MLRKNLGNKFSLTELNNILSKPLTSGFAAGKGNQVAESDNGVAQIRPTNILVDGELLNSNFKYIPDTDVGEEDFIQKGEVLFNNTNSEVWVGKSLYFDGKESSFVCSNHVTRISVDEDATNGRFLVELLNCFQRIGYFQKLCTKFNNQAGVNSKTLSELLIPLPPLPIQEKLVEEMERARESRRRKLSEADALLSTLDGWLLDTLGITPPPEDNRKVFAVRLNDLNNRLDVHANQSRFRELFKRLNEMPFQVLPLSKLTTNIFSGTTPKVGSDAYVEPPNGIAFVRSGEIGKDGVVAVSNEIHISNETHDKKMKSSQLKRNDVLIAIVGATIGNVGVFDSDKPANINQAIASVRLNGAILPKYLVCYLKSKLGQQVLDYLKRPVARANINLDEIGSIPVPVVSKDLQKIIVDKFNELREESQRLKAEAESEWQAAKDWFEAQLLGK